MHKKTPISLAIRVSLGCFLLGATGSIYANDQPQGDQIDDLPPEMNVHQSSAPIFLPPPAQPRDNRIDRAQQEVAPLSPEEVRQFQRDMMERERAMTDMIQPNATAQTHSVSMQSGELPPVVKVSPNFVSTLVFVDSNGNPWPIAGNPTVGAPDLYQASVEDSTNRNVITVSALRMGGMSNLAINLEGQTVPLMVMLDTDTENAHLRSDIRIAGSGPNSKTQSTAHHQAPEGGLDPVMNKFVDGVIPANAEELNTSGSDAFRVYLLHDQLYIRTTANIRSPRAQAVSSGVGGVRVFRMNPTPVVLFSHNGNSGQLRINLPSSAAISRSN